MGAAPETQGVTMVDPALAMQGLGFERVAHLPGSTYKDNSTVIVVPTRGIKEQRDGRTVTLPMVHLKVVQAWQNLISPMNQKRAMLFATGDEVGTAYNNMIAEILKHPDLSKYKYLMTLEDDNLPPMDAHVRLLESIEAGPFDAVSGLYFTKGDYNMPMAYGDPAEYQRTGQLDFRPRDVRAALQAGNVMEVNGIAMGCGLWRMSLFKEIAAPWFVTMADVVPDRGAVSFTQDLSFCEKAKKAGKRFGVDLRVKVGHLDVSSGITY